MEIIKNRRSHSMDTQTMYTLSSFPIRHFVIHKRDRSMFTHRSWMLLVKMESRPRKMAFGLYPFLFQQSILCNILSLTFFFCVCVCGGGGACVCVFNLFLSVFHFLSNAVLRSSQWSNDSLVQGLIGLTLSEKPFL